MIIYNIVFSMNIVSLDDLRKQMEDFMIERLICKCTPMKFGKVKTEGFIHICQVKMEAVY